MTKFSNAYCYDCRAKREPVSPALLWIRREADRRGIGQRELARWIGVSESYLNRITSGRFPMTTQFAQRLIDFLDKTGWA